MNTLELDIINIMLESSIVVKGVLFILVIASIISWVIILKKMSFISIVVLQNKQFYDKFSKRDSFDSLYLLLNRFSTSSFGIIFKYSYNEIKYIKSGGKELSLIERGIKRGANRVNLDLGSNLSLLASIGSISPFIGLFGTVWGIINSFSGLSSGRGIEAIAPGIAEALVATAIGLGVAIPAVFFYNYFTSIIKEQNVEIDSFGQELLNAVEKFEN